MELTERQALEITRELWVHLARTGGKKERWEGWAKYGYMYNNCPLCRYGSQVSSSTGYKRCFVCPYYKHFGKKCYSGSHGQNSHYQSWEDSRTIEERIYYADLFLKQINEVIASLPSPINEDYLKGFNDCKRLTYLELVKAQHNFHTTLSALTRLKPNEKEV